MQDVGRKREKLQIIEIRSLYKRVLKRYQISFCFMAVRKENFCTFISRLARFVRAISHKLRDKGDLSALLYLVISSIITER